MPKTRLAEPLQGDRLWFNKKISDHGKDLFSDPHYHPDLFDFRGSKIIYPAYPERLSHAGCKLIKKQGNPHPDIWINRVDLFFISIELPDGEERCYSMNLAALSRARQLKMEELVAQDLPEGATVQGQTYWRCTRELVLDLIAEQGAVQAFVSPFLHHLATGTLEPNDPLVPDQFTPDKVKFVQSSCQRKIMRDEVLFTEHQSLAKLRLNGYGVIEEHG